jgi:hypothetical protein
MFISFGRVSKKMLIPLFIPVIYLFRHYVLEAANNDNKSVFMNTSIVSICYSLNIFPFIIESCLIKSKRKKSLRMSFDNQLLIEKKKIEATKMKKQIFFFSINILI